MTGKLPYIAGAVVAAILIGGTIFYFALVHPWVAMPDEPRERIEARFAKVEELAALPDHCRGERTRLDDAIGLLAGTERDIDGLLWPEDGPRRDGRDVPPWLDPEDLPRDVRSSLRALVDWRATGGGLGADPCDSSLDVLDTMQLGELTLAVAEDRTGDPHLAAVMHLSYELRTCGGTMPALVGLALAQRAVDWAEARGVRPAEVFRRHRPTAAEALPLLAREAVCGTRLVEEALQPGGSERLGGGDEPWYVTGEPTLERELLMLKQYYANALERASKTPDDLAAMADELDIGDREQLPRSLVVHAVVMSLSTLVDNLAETIEAYDGFLEQGGV
jgi:hypothetical protein